MDDGELADGELADGELADGELADGELGDGELADGLEGLEAATALAPPPESDNNANNRSIAAARDPPPIDPPAKQMIGSFRSRFELSVDVAGASVAEAPLEADAAGCAEVNVAGARADAAGEGAVAGCSGAAGCCGVAAVFSAGCVPAAGAFAELAAGDCFFFDAAGCLPGFSFRLEDLLVGEEARFS